MRQRNNSQAAKVILSELYVTWASDPKQAESIRQAMTRVLSAAKQSRPAGVTPTINTAAAADAAAASRHVDPMGDGSAPLSSPPSTPPQNRRRSNEGNFMGTGTSPNPRLAGVVDELENSQRGSSPAPLPHNAIAKEVSPPATQPIVSPRIADPMMGAVAVTVDLPVVTDLSASMTLRESHSLSRHVHTGSGQFAASPPADLKRASLADIPVFYTKTEAKGVMSDLMAEEQDALAEQLARDTNKPVRKAHFGDISSTVFKVPVWLKDLLFETILAQARLPTTNETLTGTQVTRFYNEVFGPLSPSRRLFELIRQDPSSESLTLEDLKHMARYLVSSHPGLEFLQQPEFQDYYCRTVAIRIMYMLERQQSRRIRWRDFDRSNFPEVMMELDSKDVNQVLEYFSYEHFYVLYCKFWELDTDRDLLVDYEDLCGYGQGSVVPSVIRRVVEGCGRPLTSEEPGHLDYEDFVYFCLSEEDKNSEAAIYYWFKILDLDGDGILSGYELFQFYCENRQRFLEFSESPEGDISYEDMLCQMLDMLGYDRTSAHPAGVTLGDLRACPSPSNFFNMIFNAPKFMLFEHRDPFFEHQQKLRPEKSDWDRFARAEYDRLATEAQ